MCYKRDREPSEGCCTDAWSFGETLKAIWAAQHERRSGVDDEDDFAECPVDRETAQPCQHKQFCGQ